MAIIQAYKLVFDYTIHNEQGEVEAYHRAIDQVSLKIKAGDFIAILGHNGSGKSTLAKHLNALLTAKSGTLLIKNYDASQPENIWAIRQTAGMVFQNPDNQIIATIVEEDVAFGPENLGIAPEEIRKRVDTSLQSVGMSAYKTDSPNKLSGGQKQRIAIAGVLAMKPDCIVLDEPTAMLDPSGREDVLETVKKLNKEEGITVILITHLMEEAALSDYILVMEKGKIALEGAPREIFPQVDKMKALGLDVPVVTELAYKLKASGIKIRTDILTLDEMVEALCQLK